MTAPSVIDLYRFDFRSFIDLAFRELYPGKTLIANWHLDVIADRLMRCAPGGDKRFMLNAPPRSLKSLCASIAWPLFLLARHPTLRICVLAGTRGLAADLDDARRQLLRSQRIQRVYPSLKYVEASGGLRFANGSILIQGVVGRSQVGRGADIIIIDDPLPPALALDEARRSAVNEWYGSEIVPRLNTKKSAAILLVMQRVHRDDLSGHLLRSSDHWSPLKLAAIAPDDEVWKLAEGGCHVRRRGEPLCPAIEDSAVLQQCLLEIEGPNFAAQYLQEPISNPGNSVRRAYIMPSLVPNDWIAGTGMPCRRGSMGTISINTDILHRYFGEPHPLDRTGYREMTLDEWEIETVARQAALVAEVAQDSQRHDAQRNGHQS